MIGGPEEHRVAGGARGWLESPSLSALIEDCLMVSGWAFGTTSTISGLSATVSGVRHPLQHGLRRDDVARVYPGEPSAASSGFSGYIELDSHPEESASLEVWATFADGRTSMLFKRKLTAASDDTTISSLTIAANQVAANPRSLLSVVVRTFRSALGASAVVRTFRSALGASAVVRTFRSAMGSRSKTASSRPKDNALSAFVHTARASLASFLASRSELIANISSAPTVSVVIVVWNHAELTLKCLQSLTTQTDIALEIIVVDNASSDETPVLLSRIKGVKVLTNSTNLGFIAAANTGAQHARSEFLLFLNNDTEVAPNCIAQLVATAHQADSIGAVGGKLVFPDGRLQEAGSIVWPDGSCAAYGRGSNPASPEYNFERPVDYCSGALLLTRRSLFETVGGFDERYRPAYYEDADYCATLWTRGRSVIYQPKAVAVHHEFGSAGSLEAGVALQLERRPIFVGRHREWLESQRPQTASTLAARSHPHGQPAVIVVDDALPHQRMGAGFPRAAAIMRALTELGFLITIYTTSEEGLSSEARDEFPAVEAIPGRPDGMRAFFASRSGTQRNHVAVIVSRPHNMRYVKAAVGSNLANLGVPCLYDAEAIYALRDIGRRNLDPQPHPDGPGHSWPGQSLIDAEISLTRGCAAVITVSESERKLFSAGGTPSVAVIGHAVVADPTPNAFQSRQTILFVGAFGSESPNEDAVRFLCRDILPALRAGGCHAPLVVAGAHLPDHIKEGAGQTVSWHSDVRDLASFYNDARVFVAPNRYSAGIPLKIIEAAARGVPIVCAPRLAQQLGWNPGTELLTGETSREFAEAIASVYTDPVLWLRLRDGALARVTKEHSPAVLRAALREVLKQAIPQVASDQTSHVNAASNILGAPG